MNLKSILQSNRSFCMKVFRMTRFQLLRSIFCIFLFIGLAQPNILWATVLDDFSDSHSDVTIHYGQFSADGPVGLAVEMSLRPGWHTYYKEPGKTGYGLKWQWTGSSGTPLSETIYWQLPHIFTFLGQESWGYTDRAIFFIPLKDLETDTLGSFVADFLVCETTCVPQLISGNLIMPEAAPTLLSPAMQSAWRQSSETFVISGKEVVPGVHTETVNWRSILTLAFFGFLGGIILNLMPCVFPVLSLKILGLVAQQGLSDDDRRREGLYYTVGIQVAFFCLVSVLLIIKGLGGAVGWGFQMQSPAYVFSLILILSWVMWHLLDVLPLPQWLAALPSKTSTVSVTHPFWTGILVTAVATPCTAPFMAPAIGVALSLPYWAAFLIFQTLALGLAAPFLVLAFQPRWTAFLPKPGAWMQRVKQISAIPMGLAIVWLIWVLMMQTGGFGALLATVAVGVLVLFRWLSLDKGRVMFIVLCVGLLGMGHFITTVTPVNNQSKGISYSESYSADNLSAYRDSGRPVLVDVTAAWCLTCQFNERTVLKSDHVQSLFSTHNVALLVADWTQKDPAVQAYLNSFQREGVPLYVYYPPHGEPVILPEILTIDVIETLFEN